MTARADLPALPFDRPSPLDIAPLLRTLQAQRPITRVRTMAGDEAWLVTRYDEVKALFADDRLARSHPDPQRAARISNFALLGGPQGNYQTEDADHAQMRALLTPSFSARRMRALQPHIEGMVDELLDRLANTTPPVDLHEALSFPLPVLVICELLGVPFADREQFRTWSQGIADLQDRQGSLDALASLVGYMAELVERKRVTPGDDVISDLIEAQGGQLENDQIAELSAALLFAGHETTVTRIDFGTVLIITHPDQRDLLLRDASLVPTAVEEILRVATPGGSGLPRYARADIEMGGVTIRAGEAVILNAPAANHDGRAFADADRFDIARHPNPHLTFGYGARFCIGASLARVELQAVFSRLPQHFPTLRLAVPLDQLRLRPDLATGGLAELPVTW